MEETFMKFSKCGVVGAGISGLLCNCSAYQRWIRNSSEPSKFHKATLEMCGLEENSKDYHHKTIPSAISKSEAAVQRTLDAFEGFMNPYNLDNETRHVDISSGAAVSTDIKDVVLKVEIVGNQEKKIFVAERLTKHSLIKKDFFEPVTNPKLKTMELANKVTKLDNTKGQVVKYRG